MGKMRVGVDPVSDGSSRISRLGRTRGKREAWFLIQRIRILSYLLALH